jgi:hypothetical protein
MTLVIILIVLGLASIPSFYFGTKLGEKLSFGVGFVCFISLLIIAAKHQGV